MAEKTVRQVLFFIIVGTNGTGKTTLTKKLIDNRKTLVVDPDGLEWSMLPTIDISEITQLKDGKKARIIAPDYKDIVELVNYTNATMCEAESKKVCASCSSADDKKTWIFSLSRTV
jgi:ABC-type Mn2+/Zn2+ transport system ATPase subunit